MALTLAKKQHQSTYEWQHSWLGQHHAKNSVLAVLLVFLQAGCYSCGPTNSIKAPFDPSHLC